MRAEGSHLLDLGDQSKPIRLGHQHVGHDEIELLLPETGPGRRAFGRGHDRVAGFLQPDFHQEANIRLVVHNDYRECLQD